MNIYKEIVNRNLAKILTLYNSDIFSDTYGYGDRDYWGWKIKDFANGTMQGGIHCLSIAYITGLYNNKNYLFQLLDAIMKASKKIMSSNGSFSEAYPRENSFCVTALVAFDLLSSIDYLQKELSEDKKQEYLEIIRPMIHFICRNDEKHAIISNHIATGIAAIILWNNLSNEENLRHKELLKILYANQSSEGWFREYEGADPGYQTLCTYYLASAYLHSKDEELKHAIDKSAAFLTYFFHPDGSVGGLYGSRNTEVYYPGGIVALMNKNEHFAQIELSARTGYLNHAHILPESIDIGNFIPLINSYAFASFHYDKHKQVSEQLSHKPAYMSVFEKKFPDAGIHIQSTNSYYSIINYKKGGTIKVFDKSKKKLDFEDGGIAGYLKNGKKFSSQMFNTTASFTNYKIQTPFFLVNEDYPTPFQFAILRGLSLTIFRSTKLGNIFKQAIVKKLMTRKEKMKGSCKLQFEFKEERIEIRQKIQAPPKTITYGRYGKHKSIHMASSGYYTCQNEIHNQHSKIVHIHDL